METLIVTPPPQPSQAPANIPSEENSGDSGFGSVLSNAIEENSNDETTNSDDQTEKADDTEQPSTQLSQEDQNDTENAPSELLTVTETTPMVESTLFNGPQNPNAGQANSLLNGQTLSGKNNNSAIQNVTNNIETQNNSPLVPEMSKTDVGETKTAEANKASAPNSQLLLEKLQNIIASSNEKGLVSIRNTQQNGQTIVAPLNQPALPITTDQQANNLVAAVSSKDLVVNNGDTTTSKVAQLRQEGFSVQNSESRVQPQNPAFEQNSSQTGADSQSHLKQTGLFSTQTVSAGTVEQNQGNFNQTLNTLSDHSKPVITPPGSNLTNPASTAQLESDILNQVIQRFNVNPRLQTSKLSIQLNPAELGELKIDIFVKGDGIRANIVAQSQQAQELIDRNLAKLRDVLEQQGFTIEELVVSYDQGSQSGSNMFQEHFSNSEGRNQKQPNKTNSDFIFPLDDTLLQNEEISSGVNVKI